MTFIRRNKTALWFIVCGAIMVAVTWSHLPESLPIVFTGLIVAGAGVELLK